MGVLCLSRSPWLTERFKVRYVVAGELETLDTPYGRIDAQRFMLTDDNPDPKRQFEFGLPSLDYQLVQLKKRDKKRLFALTLKAKKQGRPSDKGTYASRASPVDPRFPPSLLGCLKSECYPGLLHGFLSALEDSKASVRGQVGGHFMLLSKIMN